MIVTGHTRIHSRIAITHKCSLFLSISIAIRGSCFLDRCLGGLYFFPPLLNSLPEYVSSGPSGSMAFLFELSAGNSPWRPIRL